MKFTTPRLNIHQNAAELMQQSPLVYPMLYASSFNTLNKSGYTNVSKVESRTSSLVLSRCGNVTEQVTQTLNYLPYGEDWVDIQNFAETQYPRLGIYSFNGKEKDYESGYHYYGARYYWSEVLTGWLSVDPMMDKYPSMSPYNYCAWNPVNVVDPNGMDTIFSFALKTNDAERNAKNKKILQWMRDLGDNPNLFIISMHGTPKYMEYVNNNDGHKEDQFVRLTPKMLAQKIKSDYNIYSH